MSRWLGSEEIVHVVHDPCGCVWIEEYGDQTAKMCEGHRKETSQPPAPPPGDGALREALETEAAWLTVLEKRFIEASDEAKYRWPVLVLFASIILEVRNRIAAIKAALSGHAQTLGKKA